VKWIQKEQCSYAELTGTQKLLWVRWQAESRTENMEVRSAGPTIFCEDQSLFMICQTNSMI
jgi:hypothetical protein